MPTTISGTSLTTGSIDLTTPLATADGGTGTNISWNTFTPTVTGIGGTFGSPTVTTARYSISGKTMHLMLSLSAQVATGSPTALLVTLPNSSTSSQYTRSPAYIVNNTTNVIGQFIIGSTGNETKIGFSLVNSATFDGAGPTTVQVMCSFEIS